mgnify:CR=1 FL=1
MAVPYGPLLVVEDTQHILDLLAVTLRFKGYPVVTAKNGEEALEKVEEERPALIITDILMPRMDGFALMYSLRQNPKTSQIPVVFLSATYITTEDKEFALKLGAVRFLVKPIDTAEFLLTIAEILTEGAPPMPPLLSKAEFYHGYRERLEEKLNEKVHQISRTERLLQTLSTEQKPAFEALLVEASEQKKEIQIELDQLFKILADEDFDE